MKKPSVLLLCLVLFLIPSFSFGEEKSDWADAPIITKAYELESGKLYLEWDGNAPIYQVYMDGASVANVIVTNAVIPIKRGTHNICVYPINESKSADTAMNIGFDMGNKSIFEGSLGFDLATLGLDPKKLTAGTASDSLYIDYNPDMLYNSAPDELAASTDFDNRVNLSFVDRYYADEYAITIRYKNDVTNIRFNLNSEDAASYITKANNLVTLVLDPTFLAKQHCMIPELGEKYTFTVQLRKYAMDLLTGEKEPNVIHESKVTRGYDYTPIAAWKTAPIITYASQTADGQLTIKWEHDDNEIGCEYSVVFIKKTLGVKTGEDTLATTKNKQVVIQDLMNGGYTIAIVPLFQGEKGTASDETFLEIKNEWVTAPTLVCEQTDTNQVRLTWPASPNVEFYHVTVFEGNSGSLLRFVNLDYKKLSETDLPAEAGTMEYLFNYDKEYDSDAGLRLKFDVYGVRHAASGSEQRSQTTSQMIVLK